MRIMFGLIALALAGAPAVQTPPPRVPVLVELFTAEGCSSCPPADGLLASLESEQPVPGVEVVPLGLHVDYWDRLGWKDPFSSHVFTERQQAYARALRLGDDGVYTPQMVVDGQDAVVGSDSGAARKAIAAAAARPHLPVKVTGRVSAGSLRLTVDLPPAPAGGESLEAFVAVTEAEATTDVRRGENRGRTLHHVAVTRKIESLGPLDGDAQVAEGQWKLDRAWNLQGLRAVVWLQGRTTRHVYGAATAPVQR